MHLNATFPEMRLRMHHIHFIRSEPFLIIDQSMFVLQERSFSYFHLFTSFMLVFNVFHRLISIFSELVQNFSCRLVAAKRHESFMREVRGRALVIVFAQMKISTEHLLSLASSLSTYLNAFSLSGSNYFFDLRWFSLFKGRKDRVFTLTSPLSFIRPGAF